MAADDDERTTMERIKDKMADLQDELAAERVALERIEKASLVGMDQESSIDVARKREENEQRLKRAPLTRKVSQYHKERFATPDELTPQEKALKEAKASWRLRDDHLRVLGKLQFLAHLETSFGYNEETGSRVVHKPFDGVLHLEGARGLKNAVRRRRSSCPAPQRPR